MSLNKGIFLFFVVTLCITGCSKSENAATSSSNLETGTLTIELNKGYDFALKREVTTASDGDIFIALNNNLPVIRINEWVTLSNRVYSEVSSVNVFVTPKLTSVTAGDIIFNLPHLTMLAKNAGGNYFKMKITDMDGVLATESGYVYDPDEFSFTFEYTLNPKGLAEF